MKRDQDLFHLIEKYAKAVGIGVKYVTEADGRVWMGRYAQIALCMLKECGSEAMMSAKDAWQQRLDEFLTLQERESSTVIDGYLILALPECPREEMRDDIRKVEMDTSVCRKLVIWPEQGNGPEKIWRRIFKVTVLGLPPSPELSTGAEMPALAETQRILWDKIKEIGPGPAAAKFLSRGLL